MNSNFRKKMYVIMGSLCVSIMLIISVAFCVWHFQSFDATIDNKTYLDDIKANYQMLSADFQVNKSYTIYAFPSTIYMEEYDKYLKDPENGTLPEDLFGYVDVSLNDDGVSLNRVLSDKANTVGDGGTFNTRDSATAYTSGSYLDTVRNNTNYSDVNVATVNTNAYFETQYTASGIFSPARTYNSEWRTNNGNNNNPYWNYYIGDPTVDSETSTGYQVNRGGRQIIAGANYEEFGYRNLHKYCRFGFWPNVASGQGRFLPIKITIDENHPIENFSKLIPDPFADMGDPNGYHNYVFSCWTYVDFSDLEVGKKYIEPNFVTEIDQLNTNFGSHISCAAFCPMFVDNYFDIMQSLETFADSNGVIRLFPKFSNGKGTQSSAGTASKFAYGGSDSVKLIPVAIDSDDGDGRVDDGTAPLGEREQYLTFSSHRVQIDTQENPNLKLYHDVNNIVVGVIPNFNISNTTGDHKYSAAFTVGPGNWNNDWPSFFNFKQDLFNEIINEPSLGEGNYNIYLFLGDATGGMEGNNANSYTPNYDNTCFDSLIEDVIAGGVIDEDTDTNMLSGLEYLKGKNLIDLSNFNENALSIYDSCVLESGALTDYRKTNNDLGNTHILRYYASYNNTQGYYYRPYKIAIEKNNNVSFVAMTDVEGSDTYNEIQTYKFSRESRNVINPETNRAVETPYQYLLEGVNLAELLENNKLTKENVKLQMRIENDSNFEFDINGIPRNDTGGGSTLPYEQLTLGGTTYYAMNTFFALHNEDASSPYFELTQEAGTYNILFIQDENNPKKFYGYAYRLTQAFVKVYTSNLTETDEDGFIKEPNDDSLLFYADYDVYDFAKGNQISADDICNNAECTNFNKTLSDILKEYLSGVQDLSEYCLRDHVSDLIIAWFDNDENLQINPNFTVRKNYILYIDLINKV